MENGKPDVLDTLLPGTMAALMEEFLKRKDVNSRVQIRLRMKALLDYASADTEFPPNPLLDKRERGPEPVRSTINLGDSNFQQGNASSSNIAVPQVFAPLQPIAPIEGARRLDNAEILG